MLNDLKNGKTVQCFVSQRSKKDANITQYEASIVSYDKKSKMYKSSSNTEWKFAVEIVGEYDDY